MNIVSVTYASSPSSDLLIPTLEFNNETAGVIRLAQSFNDTVYTGVKHKPLTRGAFLYLRTHQQTALLHASRVQRIRERRGIDSHA